MALGSGRPLRISHPEPEPGTHATHALNRGRGTIATAKTEMPRKTVAAWRHSVGAGQICRFAGAERELIDGGATRQSGRLYLDPMVDRQALLVRNTNDPQRKPGTSSQVGRGKAGRSFHRHIFTVEA